MAKYKVTAPDGTKYVVTGPDNASHDQILAQVKGSHEFDAMRSSAPADKPILEKLHDMVMVPKGQEDKTPGFGSFSDAITHIPEEIGKEASSAGTALRKDILPKDPTELAETMNRSAGNPFGVGGNALMDALGIVASPITGTATSLAGRPIEASTGVRREIPGTIATMMIPGSGEAKAATVSEDAAKGAKYVGELLKRAGKTPSDLVKDPAHVMGKPVTGAEAIGRTGVNQLASLARRSGKTPDSAESLLRQRLETTPDRVQTDFGNAAGVDPAAVQKNFDGLSKSLRAKADPKYKAAYAEPAPVLDADMQKLMARPSMKKALVKARELAAEEGRNPDEIATVTQHKRTLVTDESGKSHYVNVPTEMEVRNPTWQTLDYVKRGVGQVISSEHKELTGKLKTDEQTRATLNTLGEFREKLFEMNPKYKEAVAAGGEPLQLEEAYHEAPKMMKGNVSESVFNKRLATFTPSQVEAFKGGWVNSVYEQVRAGTLKLKDMRSDNFQTKARTLLGWNKADEFIKQVEQEQRLVANANRMMPGRQSITGELAESGKETDQLTSDIHHAALRATYRGPKTAIMDLVIDRAHRAISAAQTPGNEAIRDEIGRLLQMKPDELKTALESKAGRDGLARRIAQAVPKATNVARDLALPAGVGMAQRGATTQEQQAQP